MELTVDDVMDGVGLPLLGIVPEDANVVLAAAHNLPLILQSGKGASIACLHIARRLCGKRMPLMKL
jgi:septum site-determining protein MinD